MSPLPTISALLLRDRMPDRNTSLPGTTVTTGAYSTWPLTTRLDRPSGKMFCRSTIVWLLSRVVRTASNPTARRAWKPGLRISRLRTRSFLVQTPSAAALPEGGLRTYSCRGPYEAALGATLAVRAQGHDR